MTTDWYSSTMLILFGLNSLFVKETLGQTREISYYENFSKVPVFHTLKLFGTINQYS